MNTLLFSPVDIAGIPWIYKYTSAYGEGSCQHSPISMWSLAEKYGDEVCEKDGCLIVHRAGISDENYRVYLAPMGDDIPRAYRAIMEDAHAHGKKVKFLTLTMGNAKLLNDEFPGQFDITNERDLAEYIFSSQTFAEFPGKFHARRRTEIRSFWRDYGSRVEAAVLAEDDLDEVRAFARTWLEVNAETHDEAALNKEMRCIERQLSHYDELGLTGTVIRIDGAIHGFCYGAPLNEEYYDVLIEKGDRAIPGIYRVIRQESTRLNASQFKYINFEEDVGVPGLRRLKESYGPAFLIEKNVATEN